jgi:hypothetical protein
MQASNRDGWNQEALDLPEHGGTVGPLPDGTVIEVEQVLLNADGEWESEDGSKWCDAGGYPDVI